MKLDVKLLNCRNGTFNFRFHQRYRRRMGEGVQYNATRRLDLGDLGLKRGVLRGCVLLANSLWR